MSAPSPQQHLAEDRTELTKIRGSLAHANRLVWVTIGFGAIYQGVGVTLFAKEHGVPLWIAWMLDPIFICTLAAAVLMDQTLAKYGEKSPAWLRLARLVAGLSTLTLNTWTPLWSRADGVWAPDGAGVAVHGLVPLVVVLVVEGISSARPRMHSIVERQEAKVKRAEHLVADVEKEKATAAAAQRAAAQQLADERARTEQWEARRAQQAAEEREEQRLNAEREHAAHMARIAAQNTTRPALAGAKRTLTSVEARSAVDEAIAEQIRSTGLDAWVASYDSLMSDQALLRLAGDTRSKRWWEDRVKAAKALAAGRPALRAVGEA